MDALEALLEQAKALVKPGGRLVVLSYHSLEDRRVKRVLSTGNLKVSRRRLRFRFGGARPAAATGAMDRAAPGFPRLLFRRFAPRIRG